ncbi:MAG: FAD-dependent oxidoreductase [Thermodesulfobacteriota bacterium]
MKKVIVLGGGFSGVESSIYLSKLGYDVTLVSNRDYLYMYPAAIWVPTREVEFEDLCLPLEDFSRVHGFTLKIDMALSVSSKENKVVFADGEEEYDYLVLAVGAGKVDISGIEHTRTICGPPEDAVEIKEKIDGMIIGNGGRIALGIGDNPLDLPSMRIGPAVELLLNLDHYLKKQKVRDKFELSFFCPVENPFAHIGKIVSKLFMGSFKCCDVPPRMGTAIEGFTADSVIFADGTKLESDLIMLTPGAGGHPLFKNSDLPLDEAGYVKIGDNCQVDGLANVFALGDGAEQKGPEWLVRQGHNAVVMGRCAAHNIHALETGKGKQSLYTDHLWLGGLLDDGNGAGFLFKNKKILIVLPLPKLGHWLKKAWVSYWRRSRLNEIPRIFNL